MATKKQKEVTSWVGWVFFASMLMILQGFFNAVAGISALFNDEWVVRVGDTFLLYDITTWGWFHLIVGIIVAWAGFSVLKGSAWARIVGILVAMFSAVGALATVDVYPIWSIIFMVVDVLIIYALAVHGDELAE